MKRYKLKKNVLFVMILVLFGFTSIWIYHSCILKNNKTIKDKVIKIKEIKPKEYKANMIMVGDALIHSDVYNDAKTGDESYDFKPMLSITKPITRNYDLAYYNQETISGGTTLGLSSYPRFNSPVEVGDAFLDSGFNLVSLATNHTMDKGEQGVLNSLDYWNKQKDVYYAGSYNSFEERDKERIKEINGIKYAFFSYTTVTNGLSPEVGKEYLDNVYSDELVKNDIERIKDKVDIIIVAMHWGTEYYNGVSVVQQNIANYLSELGANIIIGTHSHVVEPVEYLNNGQTFVMYSLGNYISDQDGIERLTGLMMELTIKKIVNKDVTTISIESPKAELIFTHSNLNSKRNFKVYPYSKLNNNLLPNYMEYYERYKSIVSERYNDLIWGIDGE